MTNMRVLITGASGNLGKKAVAALAARDDVELVQLSADTPAVATDRLRADLAVYDDTWAAAFHGVDVVLHLAGDGRPSADWATVLRSNIDVTLNVMRAAEAAHIGRFVFASSNWVLAGYRFTADPLLPSTPPRPVNPYGVSKLVVERIGFATAARTGMAFLALRIGYCQPGTNEPGPHMAFGRWGQEMWLSNEDWAHAVEQACTADVTGAAIVNVMSANRGMRWDLEETARRIGYRPRRRHTPRLTAATRLGDLAARARDAARRPMVAPAIGGRW